MGRKLSVTPLVLRTGSQDLAGLQRTCRAIAGDVPGGDPAALRQLATQLRMAAEGSGNLGIPQAAQALVSDDVVPGIDGTGKVPTGPEGLPGSVPPDWTADDLGQLVGDLEQSIRRDSRSSRTWEKMARTGQGSTRRSSCSGRCARS